MTIEELKRAAEEVEIVEYDGCKYTVNALIERIRYGRRNVRYWSYSVELLDRNRHSVTITDPESVSRTGEYTYPERAPVGAFKF